MPGPIYSIIEKKLKNALSPTLLEILDDSASHAGHAAMKGLAPSETHFKVKITSAAFQGLV